MRGANGSIISVAEYGPASYPVGNGRPTRTGEAAALLLSEIFTGSSVIFPSRSCLRHGIRWLWFGATKGLTSNPGNENSGNQIGTMFAVSGSLFAIFIEESMDAPALTYAGEIAR